MKAPSRRAIYSSLFGISTFLMVAFVIWQMLVPANVGTFNRLKLDQRRVVAGSLVFYRFHDCRPSRYKADVFRTISTNTVPPEVTMSAGSRFDDQLHCRNAILIPTEAPSGEYRLFITAEYHVNTFQHRTVSYASEPFIVVNPDSKFNILEGESE